MKISNIIKEDFTIENFMKHIKHAFEFSEDERCVEEVKKLKSAVDDFMVKYNEIADDLAKSKAGKANSKENIVGYIDHNGRAVKYNYTTGDYVVYNPNSSRYRTITLHKKTPEQYEKIVTRDFESELPEK